MWEEKQTKAAKFLVGSTKSLPRSSSSSRGGREKATNQVLGIHATQTFSKTADVKTGGFGNIDRLLFCSSKIMHKQRDGLICIVLLPLGLLYDCCITSLAAALESHLDKVKAAEEKLGSISRHHHYHHPAELLKQLVTT